MNISNTEKSKIEELCKNSFEKNLKDKFGFKNINWELGDEPPDYFLYLNNRKYAVEVTTIMESIELYDKKFPIATIYISLINLVKEIKDESIKRGYLNGNYGIAFNKPITNLISHRQTIKENAIDYIRTTKEEESARPQYIFREERENISILKLSDKINNVGNIGPPRAKWHPKAKEEGFSLLKERIYTKTYKLKDIEMPKILLLLNHHLFLDLKDYEDFELTEEIEHNFKIISIIQNEEMSLLLYNKEFNVTGHILDF